MLSHIFPTPILRAATGLAPAELHEVAGYLLSLAGQTHGEVKSNRGGWHSEGNLFSDPHPEFPALRAAIHRALAGYLGEAFGYSGALDLALTGWAVINHPGDFNVPHNHAANLLSGALYIAIPTDLRGGSLVFQDPRHNLNAHETDPMHRLGVRPPWLNPVSHITPVAGEVIVFPSWLNHYVEPFTSADPDAVRIVVSFNATV